MEFAGFVLGGYGCADETLIVDVEKLLTGLGAIKVGDSRLTNRHVDDFEPKQNGIKQGNRATVDDDDSDWD